MPSLIRLISSCWFWRWRDKSSSASCSESCSCCFNNFSASSWRLFLSSSPIFEESSFGLNIKSLTSMFCANSFWDLFSSYISRLSLAMPSSISSTLPKAAPTFICWPAYISGFASLSILFLNSICLSSFSCAFSLLAYSSVILASFSNIFLAFSVILSCAALARADAIIEEVSLA